MRLATRHSTCPLHSSLPFSHFPSPSSCAPEILTPPLFFYSLFISLPPSSTNVPIHCRNTLHPSFRFLSLSCLLSPLISPLLIPSFSLLSLLPSPILFYFFLSLSYFLLLCLCLCLSFPHPYPHNTNIFPVSYQFLLHPLSLFLCQHSFTLPPFLLPTLLNSSSNNTPHFSLYLLSTLPTCFSHTPTHLSSSLTQFYVCLFF